MEWLADDHLVYFILDIMEQLDLSKINAWARAADARGRRRYHPEMMTAVLVYGYCIGVTSSRRLERATYEDVAFRMLTGEDHPDHTSISEFRRQNLAELAELFIQVLRLCQEAGLVKLGHVALDGSKFKANASKHKAMSHERMKKTEAELRAVVKKLLEEAERIDRQEDELYGRDKRGDELPDELRNRQSRLKKIREARAKLEAEAAASRARKLKRRADKAKEKAEQAEGDDDKEEAEQKARQAELQAKIAAKRANRKAREANEPKPDLKPRAPDELPSHQVPSEADGKPTPKAQRNFTDPDSRIMKKGGEYLQGYNCQAVVDASHQVIVGQVVTNQPPDAEHFQPLLNQVRDNCGVSPKKVSADSGYWSEDNDKYAKEQQIDAYIATERLKHNERPPPVRGRAPKDLDAKGWMRRKLRTKRGRETYARRKVIVEPVFGQTKEARGIRRFLLRGLKKVGCEWALICATHNLLKLYRAQQATG
jgi:transposase